MLNGIGAFVWTVDDDDVVAVGGLLDEAAAVEVMHGDRADTVFGPQQFCRRVAIGQVLGAQPNRFAVDVDVIDMGGACGDCELADHSLTGADDEYPLNSGGQQQCRHQQRLVIDELAEFRALSLAVAEQGDTLFGSADDDMLIVGVHIADDVGELPMAGQPRPERFDDFLARAAKNGLDGDIRRGQFLAEQPDRMFGVS